MARWEHKATLHNLSDMFGEGQRSIECDAKGQCLVHDLPDRSLEILKRVLDEQGETGWELVQCHYHDGELLCLWKKEAEVA